ncbi:hypothetical protein D3C76_1379270 [compost metagenome]
MPPLKWAPPMTTTCLMPLAMSGRWISARARLVCGPSMAMVMLWGLAVPRVSTRYCTALPWASGAFGSWIWMPVRPSSPCTSAA